MIGHIFKIVRNSWKSFCGIFIEQMVVCVVLMLVVVSVFVTLSKMYSPGLLDTDNTVCFGFVLGDEVCNKEKVGKQIDVVADNLKKLDYVVEITRSMAMTPYVGNYARYDDSVRVEGKMYRVNYKGADEEAYKVFRPEMVEGEWLSDNKLEDGSFTCVVTRQFVDELKWTQPLGRKLFVRGNDFTVVGVVSGIKHKVLLFAEPAVIVPCRAIKYDNTFRELCARVEPGREKEFIMAYYKEFQRLIPNKEAQPFAINMELAKRGTCNITFVSIMLQSVPTIFLFVFAFIGTFGLFMQNSERRAREYALRLAVGATPRRLLEFVMLESVVVTLLACLPGVLLSVFIYEYTLPEWIGVCVTILVMVVFSMLSTWYPAYRVTKVNPAVTLK